MAASGIRGLGPEPLETGREAFAALFRGRRGRTKSLLLDQRVIAGIGNIYADEALFAARIHPLTSAARLRAPDLDRLWREMRRVLRRAIAARGTSVSDYRDAEGLEGDFQERLRVYGRAGEPCPRCGTPIRRVVVGGRGTHFCPRCQRRR
jgi:formamidopyrimidine-DNA glycosylase